MFCSRCVKNNSLLKRLYVTNLESKLFISDIKIIKTVYRTDRCVVSSGSFSSSGCPPFYSPNKLFEVFQPTFNKPQCSFYSTQSNVNFAEQSSIFTYLSQSTPVAYTKELVVQVHDITHLPWWASIVLITFTLRSCLTLPLAVYQNYIIAKVENLSLIEMPDLAKHIQKDINLKARQLKWSEKEAGFNYRKAVKKQWDSLIIRDNCHPFKATITLWFQIPTWICFSSALRNLAYMLPVQNADAEIIFLQMSVGGFWWIPNLTQPDGTLILPLLLGLSNLAIIEIQAMMRLRESTRLQRYATNLFRGFSIALVPISAAVPAGVTLYWTFSSLLGLGQNLILMSPRMRSMLKIPDTPSTLEHPYRQLSIELKEKLKFFKYSKT